MPGWDQQNLTQFIDALKRIPEIHRPVNLDTTYRKTGQCMQIIIIYPGNIRKNVVQ